MIKLTKLNLSGRYLIDSCTPFVVEISRNKCSRCEKLENPITEVQKKIVEIVNLIKMASLYLIFGTLFLLWIVKIVKKKYSYFSDRNVIHPNPTFPLGNFWKVGMSVHFIEKINSVYRQFKGRDILCGFYILTKPVYLILDPDLIKNILVKDFYSFHDRGLYHNEHTGESTQFTFRNP